MVRKVYHAEFKNDKFKMWDVTTMCHVTLLKMACCVEMLHQSKH